MPGEIDTSDARESATSRVLNRRLATTLSYGEKTSHSLRPTGGVIAPDIRDLARVRDWGLELGFNSCLGTSLKVVCCFESDLVLLNSYLDEHFLFIR